jgi:hypothetical protein
VPAADAAAGDERRLEEGGDNRAALEQDATQWTLRNGVWTHAEMRALVRSIRVEKGIASAGSLATLSGPSAVRYEPRSSDCCCGGCLLL